MTEQTNRVKDNEQRTDIIVKVERHLLKIKMDQIEFFIRFVVVRVNASASHLDEKRNIVIAAKIERERERKYVRRIFFFLSFSKKKKKIDSMLCNEGRRQAEQSRKERDRTRRKLINMSFLVSSHIDFQSGHFKRIDR